MLQKWLECGKKIFTVKIPSIAPTLGGPGPPDLYIGGGGGGAGPPLAPPVPTPMEHVGMAIGGGGGGGKMEPYWEASIPFALK